MNCKLCFCFLIDDRHSLSIGKPVNNKNGKKLPAQIVTIPRFFDCFLFFNPPPPSKKKK